MVSLSKETSNSFAELLELPWNKLNLLYTTFTKIVKEEKKIEEEQYQNSLADSGYDVSSFDYNGIATSALSNLNGVDLSSLLR